jgi:Ca2+-binding EF-hand superfamily protein
MGNNQAKQLVESYIETGELEDTELEKCFEFYDKSKDGSLQKKEFERKQNLLTFLNSFDKKFCECIL